MTEQAPRRLATSAEALAADVAEAWRAVQEDRCDDALEALGDWNDRLVAMEAVYHALRGTALGRVGKSVEQAAAYEAAVARLDAFGRDVAAADAVAIAPALVATGRMEDARRLVGAAFSGLPEDDPFVASALADALDALGAPDLAAAAHVAAAEMLSSGDDQIDRLRRATALAPAEPRYRLFLGEALLATGQLAEAEKVLTDATSTQADPRIQALLAEVVRQQGDPTRALQLAAAVRQEAPDVLLAVFVTAKAHADLHDVDAALADFDVLLADDPNDLRARRERVAVLADHGRAREALGDGQFLAARDPSPFTTALFGHLLFEAGEDAAAIPLLDRALALGIDDPDTRFARAEAARRLNRLDEAKPMLDALVEEFPDNAVYVGTRGQVLAAESQPNPALSDLDRALELNPNLPWVLRSKMGVLSELGQIDELVKTSDRLLAIAPDDPDAMAFNGLALLRSGHAEEGRAKLQSLVADHSDHGLGQLFLAWADEDLNLLDEARVAVEAALAHAPSSMQAVAYLAKARILYRREELDEAEVAAAKAIELEPTNAEAFFQRGRIRASAGRFAEAEADLAHAAGLADAAGDREGQAVALAWLGEARRKAGRFAAALGPLDDAVGLDDSSAFARGTRGQVLLKLEEPEKAEADLRAAMELDPGAGWVAAELAALLLDQESFDDALEVLDRALAAGERSATLLGLRGQVLRQADRADEAIAPLKEAMALAPSGWVAYELAESLLVADEAEEGLRVAEDGLAAFPAATFLLRSKADALRMLERPAEALDAIVPFLDVYDDDLTGRAIYAYVLLGLGRYEESLAAADAAVAGDPTYVFARHARVLALGGLERESESLVELDAILADDPSDAWALEMKMRLLTDFNRPDDALAVASAVLADRDDDSMAHGIAGWCLRRVTPPRMEEALVHYQRAVELDPETPWLRGDLGELLCDLGQRDEGRAMLQKVVDDVVRGGVTDADAGHVAGWAALQLDDPEQAIRLSQDGLQFEPDRVSLRCNVGLALLYAGRGELAVDEYEIVAKASLDRPDPAYTAVQLVVARAELDEAVNRGRLETVAKDAADARRVLSEAIAVLQTSQEGSRVSQTDDR